MISKICLGQEKGGKGDGRPGGPVLSFYMLALCLAELAWIFGLMASFGIKTLLRVNETYFVPEMKNLVWNTKRMHTETTYYPRFCDADDISAQHASELRIDPEQDTPGDAYGHFLKHGFTLFPNLIDRETANALRDAVITKINGQSHEEARAFADFLWQPKHRYSVDLGTADDPAVGKALSALANNDFFRTSLEKIMGPNPAVIEFNAITSEYGAKDQTMHSDASSNGSVINYARSYGPTHVLLMQLQDTSSEMGATFVCPGTHFCTEGTFVDDCEEDGMQVPTAAGDGILMNPNAWHRGMAFRDASKQDTWRVMIALTFTPAPLARAESRVPSNGISWSMEWYMYGHTLNDLAAAAPTGAWGRSSSLARRPWADLRALGLYHGPVTGRTDDRVYMKNWGFDYVTLQLLRYASDSNVGHFDEFGVPRFLRRGGFSPWLPMALHARLPEDYDSSDDEEDEDEPVLTWHEFYVSTLENCQAAADQMYLYSLTAFALVGAIYAITRSLPNRRMFIQRAVLQLIVLHVAMFELYKRVNQKIDESPWGRDIITGDRYHVHFPDVHSEQEQPKPSRGLNGYRLLPGQPTVYPDKNDVLIETRYGSRHLAMYNDFVEQHPGNRYWRQQLEQLAPVFRDYQHGMPPIFGTALAESIIEWTELEYSSRFLYQDISTGDWQLLPKSDAIEIAHQELYLSANPSLRPLMRELRFFQSECLYGHLRDTAMCRLHVPDAISTFRGALLQKFRSPTLPEPPATRRRALQLSSAGAYKVVNATKGNRRKRYALPVAAEGHTGTADTHSKSALTLMGGDLAEAQEHYGSFWYPARVLLITGTGRYIIHFLDGSDIDTSVPLERIRPFVPYGDRPMDVSDDREESTRLLFFSEEEQDYVSCQVLGRNSKPDAHAASETTTYIVMLEDGVVLKNVTLDRFAREF